MGLPCWLAAEPERFTLFYTHLVNFYQLDFGAALPTARRSRVSKKMKVEEQTRISSKLVPELLKNRSQDYEQVLRLELDMRK
jgi:hypothetical protein